MLCEQMATGDAAGARSRRGECAPAHGEVIAIMDDDHLAFRFQLQAWTGNSALPRPSFYRDG
jgi:hypothetical protein